MKTDIIISNIIIRNNVNFRVFFAEGHKIILTANSYGNKISTKEITMGVVVNRSIDELIKFFENHDVTGCNTEEAKTEFDTKLYANKTFDKEIDLVIYSNLTNAINDLATNFFKLDNIEAYSILVELLDSLKGVLDDNQSKLDTLDDDEWQILKNLEDFVNENNKTELLEEIRKHLEKRNKISYCQKTLGTYLSKSGVVLRKNIGDTYILDENNNVYKSITHDDLMIMLIDEIGKNIINDNDLEEAIGYLDKRLEPMANKVRFNNCIYDMEAHKQVTFEEPILTLVEVDYNYNPTAQSTYLKHFLETSLAKKTEDETEKTIKCLKQIVGYLLTSGNVRTALLLITGIAGGGKSIFSNVLTAIFGTDKITEVSLQDLASEYNHNTESLANTHLNIINDSEDSIIKRNGKIKQISGNDGIKINPKGKPAYFLPREQVPKTVLISNNVPIFEKLEPALLDRLVIVEFGIKFRGTEKEDPKLLNNILNNPQEIEWFIYESLEAYKNMCENKEDFILRSDKNYIKKALYKNSEPLNYILEKLITPIQADEYDDTDELKEKIGYVSNESRIYTKDITSICVKVAEAEGLSLPLNTKGKLTANRVTKQIKELFILDETEKKEFKTKTEGGKGRYYHNDETELKPTRFYDEQLLKLYKAELQELQNTKGKQKDIDKLSEDIEALENNLNPNSEEIIS